MLISLKNSLLVAAATLLYPLGASAQSYTSIAVGLGSGSGGGLQVVALGADKQVYLPVYQDGSGTWHRSGALLSPAGMQYSQILTIVGQGAGRLQVIGLGAADGYAYLAAWQDTSGTWHSSGILPGQTRRFSSLAAGLGNSAQIQVLGLGAADNLPYLAAWQDTNGNWGAGKPLPGTRTYSWLATGNGTQSELQVVGKGAADGQLYLAEWQDTGGTYHSAGTLPGQIAGGFSSVSMVNGNHANLNVIGLATSNLELYVPDWQNSGNGSWSAAGILPGQGVQFKQIIVGQGNGNLPQVLGLGASDSLVHESAYQDVNGAWHAMGAIPKYNVPVSQVVTNNGNLARLQIIGLGLDSHIDLISWQDSASGTWYAGADLTP